MRIAVTGAGGFVGRALVARLRRDSVQVLPVVRTPAGIAGEVSIDDLASADWAPLLRGIDAVAHLAARVHVMKDRSDDPSTAFRRVNHDGSVALFRGAAQAGVGRFLFVSTAKVNGETTARGQPFRAGDPPAPRGPYAISKAEAEESLRDLAGTGGPALTIIRPPLVYGPGVGANFRSLVRAVRGGLPLPLGRIDNRRSLVSVDNLVDLIALCLVHPGAAGETFMASDGHDLSTTELVRLIGDALGRRARLMPVPPRTIAVLGSALGRRAAVERLLGDLQVDIGKNRDILGWEPPMSVETALKRMAAAASR